MTKTVITINITELKQTEMLAAIIAKKLCIKDIVTLGGGLGAGKTEFTRFLIRNITGDSSVVVPSPTFTIVQTYDLDKLPIYHFDFYRINDLEEVHEVGIEEALSEGVTIIEWPSKIEGWYLNDPLHIEFCMEKNFNGNIKRNAKVYMSEKWKSKLLNQLKNLEQQ